MVCSSGAESARYTFFFWLIAFMSRTVFSKKSGIHVRRDELVSVMYSTELNSTTSLVPPQRTDRHGILDQKPPHFQRLSRSCQGKYPASCSANGPLQE